MIENVVHSIGGVGIFGIISVCLFFGFFSGMLLWAFGLKKKYLNEMGELPLEQEATRPARFNQDSGARHTQAKSLSKRL